MTLLFDTHALLWATLSPADLSSKVSALIQEETNSLLVSAATVWEIATKVRLGKLPMASAFEADLLHYIRTAGYVLLPVATAHALQAGRLTGNHRDPLDRMLAAQALALDITILSTDPQLDGFGVHRIW